MRRITTFLMLLVLATNSLNAAKAEVISIACNGGTYSVEMPSATVTDDNGCAGSLVIDSSIKAIKEMAFYDSKITSLVIPDSVKSIGSGAFSSTRNLKSVALPNSIEIIESHTFYQSGLTSVVIPDSVIEIGIFAFAYNSDLVSVKLGKSLKSLGSNAFLLTKLSSVDIPDSVTTADGAFNTNGTLKSIVYCGPSKGLPTSPTCPPERKTLYEAALKAEADARAAEDFSCLNFKVINDDGIWSLSEGPKVTKAVVTWSIFDPGNCIISAPRGKGSISWQSANFVSGSFDTNWTSARNGDNYAIVLDFDISNSWLEAVSNTQGVYGSFDMSSGIAKLSLSSSISRKVSSSQSKTEIIRANIQSDSLWGLILSKRQKLERSDCIPEKSKDNYFYVAAKSAIEILKAGNNPQVSIELSDPSNCISLVHTPPIGKATTDNLLNSPFWKNDGYKYWSNLISPKPSLIRVSANIFGESKEGRFSFDLKTDSIPLRSLDSVMLDGNTVKIVSEIDLSGVDKSSITSKSNAQIVIGAYVKYDKIGSCYSGGWRVSWTSSNSFSVRYSSGGCTPSGLMNSYQVISLQVPLLDLLEKNGVANSEAKAAAELKAMQDAEAKATEKKAAEALKAKQDAEAKAAVELKAKQDANAKALAESIAKQAAIAAQQSKYCGEHNIEVKDLILRVENLKTNYPDKFLEFFKRSFPGHSLAVASQKLLYSREELDCESFGRISAQNDTNFFKVKKEMWDSQLTSDLMYLSSIETEMRKVRNSTITCVKGKLTKKVTAVKPVCPNGYKKK